MNEEHADIVRRLIEESSLGTEGATTLRARTTRRAVVDFRRRRAESADCDRFGANLAKPTVTTCGDAYSHPVEQSSTQGEWP
jgi:hypothetical protein